MPRAPRVEFEDACYHLMARGNRNEDIVSDDKDRQIFCMTLDQAAKRAGWQVFAWVLMDNHYHLVLRTPQANLVEGMQWFQNTFTRRINTRNRVWGHLFGGRYRSILVENEGRGGKVWRDYLRTVVDYVHLNPGRAGLVDGKTKSIREYRWSSIAQGLALPPSKRPDWLLGEEVLDLHGNKDNSAARRRMVERYDGWIVDESETDLNPVVEGKSFSARLERGWFWGSDAFQEKLLLLIGNEKKRTSRNYRSSETMRDHEENRAREIIREAEQHFGEPQSSLRKVRIGDWTRAAVGWAVWQETLVSQQWIAEEMNLKSAANASQQIRRFAKLPEKEMLPRIRRWKKSRNVA